MKNDIEYIIEKFNTLTQKDAELVLEYIHKLLGDTEREDDDAGI